MAIVARLEGEIPQLGFFPIYGNIPLPQGQYLEDDREACPFTVKAQNGTAFPTQWEVVSRHADGSVAIAEICATVTRSSLGASSGQRYAYDIHDEPATYSNGYQGNWQLLMRKLDELAFRVTDQYGNVYRASFEGKLECCPLLGVFPGENAAGEESDSSPQDDLIRYHRRGPALHTVEVPMMLRPSFEANADKVLSNFGQVSAFLTFAPAMSLMVGMDIMWSATVSGGPASPKAERQWHLLFESFELEHPAGFQLYTENAERWQGATYTEGDHEVTPIVKPHYSQGSVRLSGPGGLFIPANTPFVHSPSGKQYRTVFDTVLNGNGTGSAQMNGYDPSGDASGDATFDRAFGDVLNIVQGSVTGFCEDPIYDGLKQCLHLLPSLGQRSWRFSLGFPGADGLWQAQRWSKRECWCVARDGSVGGTRLLSWQNPAAGGWYAQEHILPDLSHVGGLDNTIRNRTASVQSLLLASLGEPVSGTGGQNFDGYINPTSSGQGGGTGTIDISPWGAVEHMFSGVPEGLVFWEMYARVYKDRCRTTIVERDGRVPDMDAYGGANGFVQLEGRGSYVTNHWDYANVSYNTPTGEQIEGRHEQDAYAARRQPPYFLAMTRFEFESTGSEIGRSPFPGNYPYQDFGGGYNPIDTQHLIRWTHACKALAWLANDPIGQRQLVNESEWRRIDLPTSRWTSLSSGPESLGSNIGRANAWTTDAVAHQYALRGKGHGGGTPGALRGWCEALVDGVEHVQMRNGVWFRELSGRIAEDFPVGEKRHCYFTQSYPNFPFKVPGGAHPTLAGPGKPPTPARTAGTGTVSFTGENLKGYLAFDITAPNTVPDGSIFSRQVGNDLLFYVTTATSGVDGSGVHRAPAQAWGSSSAFLGIDTLDVPFTSWQQACAFHGYTPCSASNTYLQVTATANQDPFGDAEYQLVKPPQDVQWRLRTITTDQQIQFTSNAFELELIVKPAPGVGGLWDSGSPVLDSHWAVSFWKDLAGTENDPRPNFSFVVQADGGIDLRGFGGGSSVPPQTEWGTVEALANGWYRIRAVASTSSSAVGAEILPCVTAGQELRVGDSAYVLVQPARFDAHPSIPGSQYPNSQQSADERRLLISKIEIRNIGASSLVSTGPEFNVGYHDDPNQSPEFAYVGRATPMGGSYVLPIDYDATVPTLISAKTRTWPGIIGGEDAFPNGSPTGFRAWGTQQVDSVDTNPDPAAHYRARAACCRPNEVNYMIHALRGVWKAVLANASSFEAACKRLIKNGGRGLWRALWMDPNGAGGAASGVFGASWSRVFVRQYHNADTNVPGRFSTNQQLGNSNVSAPDGTTPYFMSRLDVAHIDNRLEFTESGGHEAMAVAAWHSVENDQDELAPWGQAFLNEFGPGLSDLADCISVIRQGGPPSTDPQVVLENSGLNEIRNTAALLARLQQNLSPGTEE